MVPASSKSSEISLSFVQRANIQKYTRLLRTVLTEQERAFVQQRLCEEQRALVNIQKSPFAPLN
jgi:hypothetical protein